MEACYLYNAVSIGLDTYKRSFSNLSSSQLELLLDIDFLETLKQNNTCINLQKRVATKKGKAILQDILEWLQIYIFFRV